MYDMDGFLENLSMGSNPIEGMSEIRTQVLIEMLHFISWAWDNEPAIFDRAGNHPAQPNYWMNNIKQVLEDSPKPPSP